MAVTSSKSEANDATQLSAILSQPFDPSIQVGKQVWNHNRVGSSSEVQPCNGKTRGDDCGQGQLLPRYRPQITDEELQQISTKYPVVLECSLLLSFLKSLSEINLKYGFP